MDNREIEEKIVEAALTLAAERSWRNVCLRDIAARAGISFSTAYELTPSKLAVQVAFSRRIDRAMLEELEEFGSAECMRDRVFDVMMRRIEAMEPSKTAAVSIFREVYKDPVWFVWSGFSLLRSMAAVLEAVGLESSSFVGRARANVLGVIWLRTFQIWIDDEADLARTMAHLDRSLRRVESIAVSCESAFGHGTRHAEVT